MTYLLVYGTERRLLLTVVGAGARRLLRFAVLSETELEQTLNRKPVGCSSCVIRYLSPNAVRP